MQVEGDVGRQQTESHQFSSRLSGSLEVAEQALKGCSATSHCPQKPDSDWCDSVSGCLSSPSTCMPSCRRRDEGRVEKSSEYLNGSAVLCTGCDCSLEWRRERSGFGCLSVCKHLSYIAPAPAVTHVSRNCLLYTSPSPRDAHESRMPSSA